MITFPTNPQYATFIQRTWARLQNSPWSIAISLGLVLPIAIAQPAAAGRYVLNQTPATIEKSFGRYWTKLTRKVEKDTYVTYTYSPAPLRKLFPAYSFATLSMLYVNGKVQRITMQPYRTAQEKAADEIKMESKTVIAQALEAKLFEVIFGYRPPIYKPLHLSYGIDYIYTNCLGDGVDSTYSIIRGDRFNGGISMTYNSACEPPYDRIKYTEDQGPIGG
ncbi:MAG: hypothetical protein KME43_07525 [Myxacorys chilensis ATA2-1-KO14]|jgi:hypothetical protein|nr:hypothetical protein [Myxacorys chilensis ATA2-1-KO14]